MSHRTWERGEQMRLAEAAGISRQYLNDIIKKRKRATPELAAVLATKAEELGIPLSRMDFLYPHESRSPLIG